MEVVHVDFLLTAYNSGLYLRDIPDHRLHTASTIYAAASSLADVAKSILSPSLAKLGRFFFYLLNRIRIIVQKKKKYTYSYMGASYTHPSGIVSTDNLRWYISFSLSFSLNLSASSPSCIILFTRFKSCVPGSVAVT